PAGGGEIHGDAEPLHAIAPERALLVRGALVAPAFPENAAQGSGVAALHPQAVAVRAAGGTFTLDAGQARLAVEVGLALGLGASAPGLAAVTAAAEGERGAEGQGSDEPEWDPTSHRATASRILSMGVRIAEGQSISRTSQTSPGLDRTLVLWALRIPKTLTCTVAVVAGLVAPLALANSTTTLYLPPEGLEKTISSGP